MIVRTRRVTIITIAVGVVACHRNSAPKPAMTAQPPEIILAVPASIDSTLKLAAFALRTIEGTLQAPRFTSDATVVSTHYVRERRGRGLIEVAVIAAIDRRAAQTSATRTLVRLSALALDMPQRVTLGPNRVGIPGVPGTATNTSLIGSTRPRVITPADTSDWLSVGLVAEEFLRHGARRIP